MSSFEAFLGDVGKRPGPGLTLDRIDVNGNYEKSNCRWADWKTQERNRRNRKEVRYGDLSMSIGEWSDLTGLPYRTIWDRIKRGWSVGSALGMEERKA